MEYYSIKLFPPQVWGKTNYKHSKQESGQEVNHGVWDAVLSFCPSEAANAIGEIWLGCLEPPLALVLPFTPLVTPPDAMIKER